MLDQILTQVKESIGDKLSEQGLNQSQRDKAVELAGKSVQEVVKVEASGGNLDGLLSLFGGKSDMANNPIVKKIGNLLANKLVSYLNLPDSMAATISKTVVPTLINTISAKFQQSDKSGADGLMEIFKGMGSEAIFSALKGNAGNMLGGLFGK
ncbi:hypothetical protein AB9P05_15260 [Roseivirga sp. BDSF3-8]|uniref:hypothetical protein n=1 Tax=Roseivirga sp. BDSF3-8 TaxID=3241598 RepID=UPI003531C59C